jgi:hypothetical protein
MAALAVALAGCADNGPSPDDPSRLLGHIAGVVVDERIVPIEGATLSLQGVGVQSSTASDAQGEFRFEGLAPGTYVVQASHLLHSPTQATVEVRGSDAEPPATKLLLARLFEQQAYSEATKFEGYIQCGYSLQPVIETQCVDDYSRFVVAGGVAPQAKSAVDNRFYISAVGPGWQAIVLELAWEPTAQGTSGEMFLTTSYLNRTGTDWFANVDGPSPLLARLEVGQTHSTRSGSPDRIPGEGIPDLYTFAGIHGDPAAVGVSQPFVLLQHNFYYGAPPPGWSFVAGDPVPF